MQIRKGTHKGDPVPGISTQTCDKNFAPGTGRSWNMKKIHKDHADRQAAYRTRKRVEQEEADEEANERAQCAARNICSFSETGFETPAKWCHEEIQVHRSWLRALGQSDVLPGESLKELARRTWNALLNSSGLGVTTDGGGKWVEGKWVPGFDVWLPYFDQQLQDFQG